jgi:AhpD family alkylhydroperoxidase
MRGYGMLEWWHERSHSVDEKLKALAETKAACLIGCEFCLDIGSHLSRKAGVSDEQLRSLHAYQDSPAFSPLERLVLEYAEAMCQMPVAISDELFARMREHFDERQIVELTAGIAIENFRARFNSALGITPAGFSSGEYCALPDAVAAQEMERTSA